MLYHDKILYANINIGLIVSQSQRDCHSTSMKWDDIMGYMISVKTAEEEWKQRVVKINLECLEDDVFII